MRASLSLIVLSLVVGLVPRSLQNPMIEENPKDVNASIGGEAVFRCSFKNISNCNLTFVRWFINSKDLKKQQELEYTPHFSCEVTYDTYIGISTLTLSLSKSSDLQWNYSEVHCNGLSHVDVIFNKNSAPALLRIQGTLDKPPGLEIELSADEDSLIISWNFPYTLTGVELLKFLINISSCSISNGSSLSPLAQNSSYMDTVNGSTTSFQYNATTSCTIYNVSVQAVTLAGLGYPNFADQTIYGRAPKKLAPKEIARKVSYNQESSQNMTVTCTFNDSNCESEQADMVDIVIYTGTDVIFIKEKVELTNLSYTEREFAVTLPSTVKHLQANATINLTNSARNKFTESMPIILNLYDVQDLGLGLISYGVEVKCVFAENTNNENCKVVVWCDDCNSGSNGYEIELSPERRVVKFSTCKLPCNSSVYCFLAFDVYDHMGTPTSAPAVRKSDVTVTKGTLCPVTSEVPTKTGTPNVAITTEPPGNTSSNPTLLIGTIVSGTVLFCIFIIIAGLALLRICTYVRIENVH